MEDFEFHEEPKSINYNALNGLNLYSEELGNNYLENGINPLGDDFVLTENFVIDALENDKNKQELQCPAFLEQNENDVEKSFQLSLSNVESLISKLGEKMGKNLSPKQKSIIAKQIQALKMFKELLKVYIQKLKKEKNKFQMFLNLMSINWALCEDLSASFTSDFDMNKILQKVDEQVAQIEAQNEALKEQAREIIAKNQKAMEEQQKQEQQKQDQQKEEPKQNLNKNNNDQQKYEDVERQG